MKRDADNAVELINRSKTDPLLGKQLGAIYTLPPKDQAEQAVKIGRMRGLYFSENDWIHLIEEQPMKKAA